MAEEQQKCYAEMLEEYLNRKEKIMKEIYQEIGDPPVIIENFERRIYEAERKRIDSMERYIFGSIEKAVERLSVAVDQLEETRFLAWKEKAEYVKKLTNKSINGFVRRDANLGLFHRLDELGRLITSAEGKDRGVAIENYKNAISMTESLWRDIELIKEKFSFRYVSTIGIPIIVAAIGAGSTIYHFTGQNELFVLTILFSLVISTGLISVLRGRIGIEIVAFAVFLLIIIWLGANVVGIKLSDTLSSFVISFLAGVTAASIVSLNSSLAKRLAAGKRK